MSLSDAPSEVFRRETRDWLEAHLPAWRRRHGPPAGLEGQRAWQAYLAGHGWGAPGWPVEYGGRGLGVVEQMIWTQERIRAGAQTWFNVVGYGMAGPTVIAHGTPAQKERFLPPMLRGDEVWCQLFSEPGAGSDLASLTTRAVRTSEGWVVTGQKVWSSGAHEADRGILLARHDPSLPKHLGLVYLLCDMRADGVTVRPLRQVDGGAHFSEVFLDDVLVPDGNRLGEPGEGWTVTRTTLLHERMALGGGTGDYAIPFERLRAMAGPEGRLAVVDAYVRQKLLAVLNARILGKLERGRIPTAEGSALKLLMAEHITASADLAATLQGPESMLAGEEGTPQHAVLMERAWHIGGGTDEVQRNAIAERVLGLPRDEHPDRDLPFRDARR